MAMWNQSMIWVVGFGMARDRRFRISTPAEFTVTSPRTARTFLRVEPRSRSRLASLGKSDRAGKYQHSTVAAPIAGTRSKACGNSSGTTVDQPRRIMSIGPREWAHSPIRQA
jgi:hypothetical protein